MATLRVTAIHTYTGANTFGGNRGGEFWSKMARLPPILSSCPIGPNELSSPQRNIALPAGCETATAEYRERDRD